jgi:hypothetical protein
VSLRVSTSNAWRKTGKRPLLARISDLEQLEELADQLLLSPDGAAWLTQVKQRLETVIDPAV